MAYKPEDVPISLGEPEVRDWVREELQRISNNLQAVDNVRLQELHVEPSKPRAGMIVLADGTDWDPDALGTGGFFGYYGGAWVKLG